MGVFTVSQAGVGARQDFTVRSILIDKSSDPSWLGCRPSLPNNQGLPRKAVKLSAKGMFLLRQQPFSHRWSWRRWLVATSPKRGGGSGSEIITCFPVSSRLSIRWRRSSDFSFKVIYAGLDNQRGGRGVLGCGLQGGSYNIPNGGTGGRKSDRCIPPRF